MDVDFLIIGQGISGTWLSYFLLQRGKKIIIIDQHDAQAASRLAAGIINPVTGRRHVEVWMVDEILPFAEKMYRRIGDELGIKAITEKSIIDFFPSPQMRVSFMQRVDEKARYVSAGTADESFRDHFNFEFGYGVISPVYTAHLENLLPAWRKVLQAKQLLREIRFNPAQLELLPGKAVYEDITAEKIIFCDGTSSARHPLFERLPFAPNKGELLRLTIPGLSPDHIFKKGMTLAPLAAPGQWWLGSSYEWEFDHPDPTTAFYEKASSLLRQWLNTPFTIDAHLAGIRPATLERRPFVGLHPLYPSAGILNGMGAKGCSLAPYFAQQLAAFLCDGTALHPEASIDRFRRLLTRPINP